MKKCSSRNFFSRIKRCTKIILYMKLSITLLLISCLRVSANSYSQKLNLTLKNASYSQAFSAIEQKTKFRILYSDDLLPENTVNVEARNEPLTNVLNHILYGSNLTYKVLDNKVIVISRTDAKFQVKTISGTVTDTSGNPLSGVSVMVKGTTKGTVTNTQGMYSIDVPDNNVTLVFVYVGYATQERAANTSVINVSLVPLEAAAGSDIVVTALGLKQSERGLSYNIQKVGSDQITNIKQTNVMNALNGKVAGLSILSSASGVGGSVKVRMRGDRSIQGNNQPLYVIDGIPMLNNGNGNGEIASIYGNRTDPGDGISNINPDDIESMEVLDGAAAAALYGSQAQNGVILITTKKGKEGRMTVNFSSGYQNSHIAYEPKFQNKYGQSTFSGSGDLDSWGGDTVKTAYNNLKSFYQSGQNFTNAVNLSSGSKNAQTYFSYANTHATGVEPTNSLMRHNFNFRETGSFLNDKLTVDASVNYINQRINNSPRLGGYDNPLVALYLFPRGVDINPYKTDYLNAGAKGFARQNWITNAGQDFFQQNPWWILYKMPTQSVRNRFIVTASVKYTFAPWLNVQARGNLDRLTDEYTEDRYSGTAKIYNLDSSGNYTYSTQTVTQKYGDLIANFKIPLNTSDFNIDGLVGTSIQDNQTKGLSLTGDLSAVDFFAPQNTIVALPGTYTTNNLSNATNATPVPDHSQLQAVFGNLNLSYKDWAYLTLTARNDWSSRLAFTDDDHYFYPSAGLSLILSQLLKLPKAISYAKVRGSYAEVGNTVYQAYLTNPQSTLNSSGAIVINTTLGPTGFKPEKSKTFEVGTDLRFLDDRLNFSFTYYNTNTINQLFNVTLSAASLISTAYINAGNVRNRGMNFTLGYDVIKSDRFSWNTTFNGSLNRNKILQLNAANGNAPFNYGYNNRLTVGGSYGDVYATTYARDSLGRIMLSGSGTDASPYKPQGQGNTYIGNPNPKFLLSWNNGFAFKRFSFSFLIDGSFGGQVISNTQAYMDLHGVSAVTGAARDNGLKVNAVDGSGHAVSEITGANVKSWYQTIGARDAFQGAYVYSATVVRLRQLTLGYDFPINKSVVKNLRLSVTGQNLFFFSKKAPFDPETAMATAGNAWNGIDIFNQPSTRDIGVNLNITF